jgi:hypothetical protein
VSSVFSFSNSLSDLSIKSQKITRNGDETPKNDEMLSSSIQESQHVVCRVCEELVLASKMESHLSFCAITQEFQMNLHVSDQKIQKIFSTFSKHKEVNSNAVLNIYAKLYTQSLENIESPTVKAKLKKYLEYLEDETLSALNICENTQNDPGNQLDKISLDIQKSLFDESFISGELKQICRRLLKLVRDNFLEF